MEPPWGVEPQAYALRILTSPYTPCSPSPSVHVIRVFTVLKSEHRAPTFRATNRATTEINRGSRRRQRLTWWRPCMGGDGASVGRTYALSVRRSRVRALLRCLASLGPATAKVALGAGNRAQRALRSRLGQRSYYRGWSGLAVRMSPCSVSTDITNLLVCSARYPRAITGVAPGFLRGLHCRAARVG
jgi:hypothetical protein